MRSIPSTENLPPSMAHPWQLRDGKANPAVIDQILLDGGRERLLTLLVNLYNKKFLESLVYGNKRSAKNVQELTSRRLDSFIDFIAWFRHCGPRYEENTRVFYGHTDMDNWGPEEYAILWREYMATLSVCYGKPIDDPVHKKRYMGLEKDFMYNGDFLPRKFSRWPLVIDGKNIPEQVLKKVCEKHGYK